MAVAGQTLFMTGGAGVVGSALIRELNGDAICLRHRSPLPEGTAGEVEGDLRKPLMGMSGAAFRELAGRIDWVVHCATETDWTSRPELIREVNERGTENAIALAHAADAKLLYVSSAYIARRTASRRSTGRSVGLSPMDESLDAYLDSKVAAEAMVRASGLTNTIARPGLVLGDSRDGSIARFQGAYLIGALTVRGQLPVVPVPPGSVVDFLPCDVVARVLAEIVRQDVTGEELWITAGERAMLAADFLRLSTELGPTIGREIEPPRLMTPDAVDRLIRPVFIAQLPPFAQRRFDYMLALTALFAADEALPSSLDAIGERLGLDIELDLEAAIQRSFLYWAEKKGLRRPVGHAAHA